MSSCKGRYAWTGRTSPSTRRKATAIFTWQTSGTTSISGVFFQLWIVKIFFCQAFPYNLQVQGAKRVPGLEWTLHYDWLPGYWAHPSQVSRWRTWLWGSGSRPVEWRHPSLHQEPSAQRVQSVHGAPWVGQPQDPGVRDHVALDAGHRRRHLALWGHTCADQLRRGLELEQVGQVDVVGGLPQDGTEPVHLAAEDWDAERGHRSNWEVELFLISRIFHVTFLSDPSPIIVYPCQ